MFTPSPGKTLLSTTAIDPAHAAVVTNGMISLTICMIIIPMLSGAVLLPMM